MEITKCFDSSIFCVRRVQLNKDLVIASPDIFQVSLGSDAEFVLLASDGLWDYMNRFTFQPLPSCHNMCSISACKVTSSFFVSSGENTESFALCFSSDAVKFVRNQLQQHGDVQVIFLLSTEIQLESSFFL